MTPALPPRTFHRSNRGRRGNITPGLGDPTPKSRAPPGPVPVSTPPIGTAPTAPSADLGRISTPTTAPVRPSTPPPQLTNPTATTPAPTAVSGSATTPSSDASKSEMAWHTVPGTPRTPSTAMAPDARAPAPASAGRYDVLRAPSPAEAETSEPPSPVGDVTLAGLTAVDGDGSPSPPPPLLPSVPGTTSPAPSTRGSSAASAVVDDGSSPAPLPPPLPTTTPTVLGVDPTALPLPDLPALTDPTTANIAAAGSALETSLDAALQDFRALDDAATRSIQRIERAHATDEHSETQSALAVITAGIVALREELSSVKGDLTSVKATVQNITRTQALDATNQAQMIDRQNRAFSVSLRAQQVRAEAMDRDFAARQARWDEAFNQLEQLDAALRSKITDTSAAHDTLHAAVSKTQRLNESLSARAKEIQSCVDSLPDPRKVENDSYQIAARAASEAIDNALSDGVNVTVDADQVRTVIRAEILATDGPVHDALQASATRQVQNALALDQTTLDAVHQAATAAMARPSSISTADRNKLYDDLLSRFKTAVDDRTSKLVDDRLSTFTSSFAGRPDQRMVGHLEALVESHVAAALRSHTADLPHNLSRPGGVSHSHTSAAPTSATGDTNPHETPPGAVDAAGSVDGEVETVVGSDGSNGGRGYHASGAPPRGNSAEILGFRGTQFDDPRATSAQFSDSRGTQFGNPARGDSAEFSGSCGTQFRPSPRTSSAAILGSHGTQSDPRLGIQLAAASAGVSNLPSLPLSLPAVASPPTFGSRRRAAMTTTGTLPTNRGMARGIDGVAPTAFMSTLDARPPQPTTFMAVTALALGHPALGTPPLLDAPRDSLMNGSARLPRPLTMTRVTA